METLLPGLGAVRDVHPLIVHFPIALWSAALLFWLLGLGGSGDLWRAGRWLLHLGVLSALAAVLTGLWAADRVGHDTPGHDLVHVHRNFMIAATALGVATAVLAWVWRGRREGWTRPALLGGLVLTVAVCALGADRGALLVYGHGIGTRVEHPGNVVSEHGAPKAGVRGEAEPSGSEESHPHPEGAGHAH